MHMKRKTFMLLMLVCLSFCLTSCSWFENPANAERIGSGYIQYDKELYYVEIDSVRYSPDRIYTNSSSRDGKNMMDPVNGMEVTCFRIHGKSHVEFIAGNQTEEYLEDYFTTNSTAIVILCVILVLCVIYGIWHQDLKKHL